MPKVACIAVVTTIRPPTASVESLVKTLARYAIPLLVVGDKKGPQTYAAPGAELLSFDHQRTLPFALAKLLPAGHYARKNLGYLMAIQRGAACLYETDDDNAPLPHWRPRERLVEACESPAQGWCNVYRAFSDRWIWPRGFPLTQVKGAQKAFALGAPSRRDAPVQQILVNGSPDVDAIWRLLFDAEVEFRDGPNVRLPANTWCPFNSQSTWWWPDAYPLLYLPSLCSFRVTDVWRSFIAQRCLWAFGAHLVFCPPAVFQDRNAHDLVADFEQEIPGYSHNHRIAAVLADLTLSSEADAAGRNLRACYAAIVHAGILPPGEIALVDAWLDDLSSARGAGG